MIYIAFGGKTQQGFRKAKVHRAAETGIRIKRPLDVALCYRIQRVDRERVYFDGLR